MIEILSILKNSTRHLHQELEQVSFAHEIMSKQINPQQYYELLWKNYCIYQQLEPKLNKELAKIGKLFPQLFHSSRLQDLKIDLTYFSQQKNKFKNKYEFKLKESSTAGWLGVLYVLEGSRLGGNVIVKALKSNQHLKTIPEFHFYQQNNINISSRWMAFQRTAGKAILSNKDAQTAVDAANHTFDYFHKIHQLKIS